MTNRRPSFLPGRPIAAARYVTLAALAAAAALPGAASAADFPPKRPTVFVMSSSGTAKSTVALGADDFSRDKPLIGDWDGNGTDTVGFYRPKTRGFALSNSNTSFGATVDSVVGNTGDVPVMGDWDGNGTDTIGLYRPSTREFFYGTDASGALNANTGAIAPAPPA